jgi:hypothetical protein
MRVTKTTSPKEFIDNFKRNRPPTTSLEQFLPFAAAFLSCVDGEVHENEIKKKEQKRIKKDKQIKLVNMIIVIIISVAALIIIIDTFKLELSKYMPFLNPMLNNFYAIIADINSFIKDLIR